MSIIFGDLIPPPKFPIIERPATIIGLLLGRDVDLITWGLPEIDIFTTFDHRTPIYILPIPGIEAVLKGTTRLQMRVNVGLDTRGFVNLLKAEMSKIFSMAFISVTTLIKRVEKTNLNLSSTLIFWPGRDSLDLPRLRIVR